MSGRGRAVLAAEVPVLVDRLAAIVYVLICAVGFGYWVVPTGVPREAPPGVAMQSLAAVDDTKVETQPVPMIAAPAPLPVNFSVPPDPPPTPNGASSKSCDGVGRSNTDAMRSLCPDASVGVEGALAAPEAAVSRASVAR